MGPFDVSQLERLLPEYYSSEKGRLSSLLEQFSSDIGEIDYSNFYHSDPPVDYFLQGDVVNEVRCPIYDKESKLFETKFPNALILSNTCDIFPNNPRTSNVKDVLLAPIIELNDYLKEYLLGEDEKKSFLNSLRRQQISHLFYMPEDPLRGIDSASVIRLDRIFWFPVRELSSYINEIRTNRAMSLSMIGHFILIIKITWHLARLPEEPERG